MRVEVEGNSFAHFTTVYFSDDPQSALTYGFDPCCEAQFLLGNVDQPHVYTEVVAPPAPPNNTRLSINGLPLLFEPISVPLGFYPGTLAQYDFTFKELYRLPAGVTVELEDIAQEVTQDLLQDSVYSTWGAPSDDELRFLVHFNPVAVGIQGKLSQPEFTSSLANGRLIIRNHAEQTCTVTATDITGRTVVSPTTLIAKNDVSFEVTNLVSMIIISVIWEDGTTAVEKNMLYIY